jgi:NADH-quinone oxidoreductase subunit F
VTGVECLRAELGEPDASGRRRPVPVRGSDFFLACDAVIAGIGQHPDVAWLGEEESFEITRWHTLTANPHSMQTTVPDIFAGGDAVTGPATVVEAIGAGKRAAKGIHAFLRGAPLPDRTPDPLPRMKVEPVLMDAADKTRIRPQEVPLISLNRRKTTFDQVALGFDEKTAKEEARRCLRCDQCIGCGECASVCRTRMGIGALQCMGAGDERMVLTDLLRPGDHCIGCGSCVQVCPRRCIEMVDQEGERRLILNGTILARLDMIQCESCGEYYAPRIFIDHVNRVADADQTVKLDRRLCPQCAREIKAVSMAGQARAFR